MQRHALPLPKQSPRNSYRKFKRLLAVRSAKSLLYLPYPVLSAQCQKSKEIQTVIVISPVSLPHWQLPETFHPFFRTVIIRRQRSLCHRGSDGSGMQGHIGSDSAVYLVHMISSSSSVFRQKLLDPVGCSSLPFVLPEPCIVQSDVGSGSVRIAVEPIMPVLCPWQRPRHRRTVELRIFRTEPRYGMTCLRQVLTAGSGCTFPEISVFLIRPQRK